MPRPWSVDLRIRMVNAVQNAESRHAAAERFDVAPSPVIKLMQAFEAAGSHEPKRMGGYKTFKLAGARGAAVRPDCQSARCDA